MNNAFQEAEAFLHEQIPLTKAMGVRVLAHGADCFAIDAPVSANSNHLRTAFGGSINAVATLAGYTLLWLEFRGALAHVVISASSIRFLQPVQETIRAVCDKPTSENLEAFRLLLQTTGKAKIQLQVQVTENGVVAARFEGTFVALREPSSPLFA